MFVRRCIALLGVLSVMLVPGVAHARPAAPSLDWGPCTGLESQQDLRCASLRLPVDWSAPDGETFDLAVARRTARQPSQRAGTLVFGPGGPGDSGVNRVRRADRFSDEQLDRFDIVSFDPRTVGGSDAPDCAPDPGGPPIVLRDQADFDQQIARNRAFWERCRSTSAVFDHAGTDSTVQDLDALRRALGLRDLTFHGSSYGTLLGQQYAERYPGRVRAVVLESVFDHSLSLEGFVRTQALALQDSFDEFVAWCERTGCAPDIRATWRSIVERSGGAFEIASLPAVYLALPDWPGFAQAIKDLDAGGSQPLTIPRPAAGAFCADFPVPVRDHREYRHLMRVAAQAGPDIRYGSGALAIATCLGWPQPVANPPHRLRVHTRTPLLLLNARHDPRTGHEWAANVAAQLGRSGRLVTYEGWGHGTYQRNACTIATVDRYLIDLTVPVRGSSCAA
ncbi:alpha/beta hydrolase [Actinoplanes sp. OR16]|uniref:alpha/beta hydrolase n=1 Tax=Actinoplanes sp. OR16 TaxID=946334 RepID=UPI000FD75BDE|nr:alpha/beta hydrolase [Actinoplanes sp. OR16]